MGSEISQKKALIFIGPIMRGSGTIMGSKMNNITIDAIAFDADDTLWINESYFRETELQLETILKKYIDFKNASEIIYKTEEKNLSLFGYGVKGFILSMIETAIEVTSAKISAADIMQIIDLGKSMLKHPIELISETESVLKELSQKTDLILLTKGDLFDQESKIARSGLAHYFKHIEIMSEKNAESYRQILKKHKIKTQNFLMIGNSLKSDILPVLNIGGRGIHIPHTTTWIHEIVDNIENSNDYYKLDDIKYLPAFITDKFKLKSKIN